MNRNLYFNILRYDPEQPDIEPYMQSYLLKETERMTLFIALNRLREEQDASLKFDFCCRAGICGACAMVINGRPGLACHTQTKDLPAIINLLPLPFFKLIGDLSVDTGIWFREMNRQVESWIHTKEVFDPQASEQRMDNSTAEQIYELERCIECGCCLAACGTARMREDFLGAAGLNRIGRFLLDPRDQRNEQDFFQLIGSDRGIFGCMGLLACEDVCPKHLPLQDQLGFIRRKMGLRALHNLFKR
ncbi:MULTISPECIES: fumarate reductase iron-sulfur subunit [unclassified Pseudodesulfovibrio]|uniref:fumarate reductase iron-sulfur subunit n=1 Tax=unclassified Pseudodesulfovibrio TaxID=2661612 RepID=UPI000FEC1645|nr:MULTISPECIES: fumarate reductase iron-sulfur subunit [unclassified Pseudodesulfovibrio]MCJ2163428.1 fumarate reductase iron-sulfur subunit [Pseudodesulfovibrio sp. S3-i]RWU06665.1 fumarate reductase iron-sulfur subunit [Pseudodesulfovibrio sp. S3]